MKLEDAYEGQKVRLRVGPHKGDEGVVTRVDAKNIYVAFVDRRPFCHPGCLEPASAIERLANIEHPV